MRFILCCFLLLFFGCSRKPVSYEYVVRPELASINLVDRNGMSETISQKERLAQYSNIDFTKSQPYQKVLRVFARDPFGSIKAIITSYYPNGQIKQYLEVKDNRAFGAYREWYTDGILKLETCIIGGIADLGASAEKSWLFDGTSKAYDECGNLIATIQYCKGELFGTSLYYHKNGNLWKRIPFERNLVEGTFEIYLENGNLLQTSEFAADNKHGKTIRYFGESKLAADETYKNGLLISAAYYDTCGKKIAEIIEGSGLRAVFGKDYVVELQEFHEGKQSGKIEVFDNESNLVKIYHMKDDLKHGEEIEFYENKKRQPKISLHWWEGKIHGTVKTWYENGNLENQREMTNNQKNGLLTAWYEDGSVMLIESYDHDKLNKGKYFKKQEKIAVSEVIDGNGLATLHDNRGNLLKKIHYFNGKPQN